MIKVAFDVDGTLIHLGDDSPRKEVIQVLKSLSKFGCHITVFSGGGLEYARMWVNRLELNEFVHAIKGKDIGELGMYDIAFDDMPEVKFGKLNIQV